MQRSQETKQTEPPGHSRKTSKFPCFAADQALRTTDYLAACELQLLSLPGCQRTNPGWRCLSSTGKSQRLSSGQESLHSQVRRLAASDVSLWPVPASNKYMPFD